MQHFPKNCFHFPESSVKFASSTKNEVRKFGEVRSSSSTEILICNPGLGPPPAEDRARADPHARWPPRDLRQRLRQEEPTATPFPLEITIKLRFLQIVRLQASCLFQYCSLYHIYVEFNGCLLVFLTRMKNLENG